MSVTTPVNLADLARSFDLLQPENSETEQWIARLLGFTAVDVAPATSGVSTLPPESVEQTPLPDVPPQPAATPPVLPTEPTPTTPKPEHQEPAPSAHLSFDLSPPEDAPLPDAPAWVRIQRPEPQPPTVTLAPTPLFLPAWSRTVFTQTLSTLVQEGRLDIQRLVNRMARLEAPIDLPRLPWATMRRGVQVLIDDGKSMALFRQDQYTLLADLAKVMGSSAFFEAYLFRRTPLHWAQVWMTARDPDLVKNYTLPPPGTPILALTDLGIGALMASEPYVPPDNWVEFAQQCRHAGNRLIAYVPYGEERWPQSLRRALELIHWHHPRAGTSPAYSFGPHADGRNERLIAALARRNAQAVTLAQLASLASRVETGLLRALRLALLPGTDGSAEADLWLSPLVSVRSEHAFLLRPKIAEILRRNLWQHNVTLFEDAWEVVKRYRQATQASRGVVVEEEINYWLTKGGQQAQTEIDQRLQTIVARIYSQSADEGFALWSVELLGKLPEATRTSPNGEDLRLIAGLALGGNQPLDQLLPNDLRGRQWLVPTHIHNLEKTNLWVAREAQGLVFSSDEQLLVGGKPLGEKAPKTKPLLLWLTWEEGKRHERVSILPGQKSRPIDTGEHPVTIETCTGTRWTLTPLPAKPPSASTPDLSELELEELPTRLEAVSDASAFADQEAGFHIKVDFPGQVRLHAEQPLVVQLTMKPPSANAASAIQSIDFRHTLSSELIEIVVTAPSFTERTQIWQRVIRIFSGIDSQPAIFLLQANELGEQMLTIDFYHRGRVVLCTAFVTRVVDIPTKTMPPLIAKSGALQLDRLLSDPPPPPDLELRIVLDETSTLYFKLHSEHADLGYQHRDMGRVKLPTAPRQFIDQLFARLSDRSANADDTSVEQPLSSSTDAMAAIGERLFAQLFPPELQKEFWQIRTLLHLGMVRTLLVISDEPWIPWELVKPYAIDGESRSQESDGFLAEMFAMTRWLSGRGPESNVEVNVARLVMPPSDLAFTTRERDFFVALGQDGIDIGQPLVTRNEVLATIQKGGVNLLHLAVPAILPTDNSAESHILLRDDQTLRPSDLVGERMVGLRRTRPLVFLNASSSGRSEVSLTGLSGWAEKLVRDIGVSAFVGTLWDVNEELAADFAFSFYDNLRAGQSFGSAFLAARQQLRSQHPNNPTWLAFTLYADPNGRVTWGSIKRESSEATGRRTTSKDKERKRRRRTTKAEGTTVPAPPIDFAIRQQQLRKALDAAIADDRPESLPPLLQSALELVHMRATRPWLTSAFDLARRGEVGQAMEILNGLDIETNWRHVVRLVITWLAGETQPIPARKLLDDLGAEISDLAADDPRNRLAQRVRADLDGDPAPMLHLAPAPSEVALRNMLGGSPDPELLAVGPSNQTGDSGTLYATSLAPALVAFMAENPQVGEHYWQDYLAQHATYGYTVYRRASLWEILRAALQHPDHGWVKAKVGELALVAVTDSNADFQEALPLTLLALRANVGATDASVALQAHLQRTWDEADQLSTPGVDHDPWARHRRLLAAYAQLAVHQLLGAARPAADLLQKALALPFGYAGFEAAAYLTLAEAIFICHPPQANDWTQQALQAAQQAAHNIADPTFLARATARFDALRTRWWSAPITNLAQRVKAFLADPQSIEFSALHTVGQSYPLRRHDPNQVPLPNRLVTANTLAALADVYQHSLAEFQRLNASFAPEQPLPTGTTVNVANPRLAPLLAARLAAEALATSDLAPHERASLIRSLVPVAVADPTALDTVLSRLLLAERPTDAIILDALTAVVPPLQVPAGKSGEQNAEENLTQRLVAALAIADERERVAALATLVPDLSGEQRNTILHEGLNAARTIANEQERAAALALLTPYLTGEQRTLVLAQQLALLAEIKLQSPDANETVVGALLAIESVSRAPATPEGQRAWAKVLQRFPPLITSLTYAPAKRLSNNLRAGLALSADGDHVAVVAADHVGVWQISTGAQVFALTPPASDVSVVALGPNGNLLATADRQGSISLWDMIDQAVVATLQSESRVQALAFSGDGQRLAAGLSSDVAEVWDVPGRRRLASLHHATGDVTSVALSDDGVWLATICYHRQLEENVGRTWMLAPESATPSYINVGGYIKRDTHAIAFNTSGESLATSGWDGLVKVWKLHKQSNVNSSPTREQVAELTIRPQKTGVALNRDGTLVAVATTDGVDIWDYAPGQVVASVDHKDARFVAFVAADRHLVTVSDNLAQVWDLAYGKKLESQLQDVTQPLAETEDLPRQIAEIRRRVGRNLTPDEWRSVLGPDEPYPAPSASVETTT